MAASMPWLHGGVPPPWSASSLTLAPGSQEGTGAEVARALNRPGPAVYGCVEPASAECPLLDEAVQELLFGSRCEKAPDAAEQADSLGDCPQTPPAPKASTSAPQSLGRKGQQAPRRLALDLLTTPEKEAPPPEAAGAYILGLLKDRRESVISVPDDSVDPIDAPPGLALSAAAEQAVARPPRSAQRRGRRAGKGRAASSKYQ